MTVKELKEYLEGLPENTRVFEERESELRELKPSDISFDATAMGNPIDETEYDMDEWEGLMQTPIVIFRAWG